MKKLFRLDPAADFVAIDVETTGYSTRLDVIVEIGALRYRNGVEVDRLVTLVKPGMAMLPWITRLTGITDEMLARAPQPDSVAARLKRFLSRRPLVVHNAAFDVPILERFLSRFAFGRRPGNHGNHGMGGNRWQAPPVLCTLRLSRWLLPHLHSRRLSALAEYFDFSPQALNSRVRFHRAGVDAEATAHVFFRLASMLAREGGVPK
ncbi:MAG: hypothetical protein A3G34_01290 [Candidatus Lindowbacteria bacterium RIFCSPLOWO2_12_FULL_62_27]|nr:MAG: hypothetical protein A3G34_01290 [Candidatus Lindowbacteria bacterium RIFCSPLOWO2_12_FULL_62_27]OGH63704.1 MAG: hypothetical protein A3I06_07745 [Candidatus Lindowbacteria bacterium RIFCSPLOWO2_02_FULL_62_12]